MEKLHVPQSRWWDWAMIGLHFVLLQTVASRLVATGWTPHLHLTQIITFMGFVVGSALGYSTLSRPITRWLNVFYMLMLLPLQWTLVMDQKTSLEEQLLSVGGRLFFSTSDFLGRRPVEDPLFFVAVMCIAFWVISSLSSYALVRNQDYLGATLPAAIGLMIIQNYDNTLAGRLWFLAFFAFVALLMLGRLQFLQNKRSWRERRIFLSPDTSVDLTSSMAVAAGLIIIMAWTAPGTISSMKSAVRTWNQVTRPWHEFREKMENAVSALESPSGSTRGQFFGSQLALGSGFPLSDSLMFQVEAPADIPVDQRPPRYFWRGRTYDRFVDGQWYTTGTTREEYLPSVSNPYHVEAEEKTPARFVFHTGDTEFSLLYSPTQPIWVSRPGVTFVVPADQGKELIAWHAYPALRGGETYQVDAVLNNPNRQQLQEAGTSYPAWVTEKYLQVPPDFSPRIQELARQITAGAVTPYDKAIAVTEYLRNNIEYAETIEEPPRNRDSLEWILFEYKKAYCVYYASADVLMLRSLGVPARMAVGFAQGERDDNSYTVRRFHAHAWPEVYFPGIGWVEFEPTAGQAPLSRPLPPRDPNEDLGILPPADLRIEDTFAELPPETTQDGAVVPVDDTRGLAFRPIYLVPLLAILAGLIIFLAHRYALHTRVPRLLRVGIERTGLDVPLWLLRWETWARLSPVERAFESVNFGLRYLDQAVPVHTTPSERATRLTRLLPNTAHEIKILLDEHQTSLYTSRTADVVQARQAAFNIRKQTILEWIRYLFAGKPRR
ncbi:MAG TPA: transglutaminase-like domain-containing protein [Anaerolineales bacterium]|nr:transglutaminase-like domain-containing protein [Anaerolineales bacterium]